jgi:predicted acyltransferase
MSAPAIETASSAPAATPSAATAATPVRLASIDAYRGLVMLLLLAEGLNIAEVARKLPGSATWQFLHVQQTHVEWTGCVIHDMIQPSFSFLVGVALPFSVANRRARGQRPEATTIHAFARALILVLLGIFLRSVGHPQTYFTFEDTLTQIGLGYGFLYLLAMRSVRVQWIALGLILVGYWAAFALWPLPGADFDWARVGVSSQWLSEHALQGFAAHWNKNSNLAWAFDNWFLNLFPREKPFVFNAGGYSTLSFIPTLGTMILGLIAGETLRSERKAGAKVAWFAIAGVTAIAVGWALGAAGLCPVVKRIWTPSWVLFSGGICFLALGLFHALVDVYGRRRWAFPLVVIGMNSIAAYLMESRFHQFLEEAWQRHLGPDIPAVFGTDYAPFFIGVCVVLSYWLLLYGMWRKKFFLRV